jgi:uncharacterized protein (UPF0210 family)
VMDLPSSKIPLVSRGGTAPPGVERLKKG